jgi:DNA repair photolyase
MQVTAATVRSILTRTSGFLRTVTSHSLQPYRGCSFGGALCGIGCYVQHNGWITRGERWGGFLEARNNAAARYLEQAPSERAWARRARGRFGIFLSSSTDPFLPQEATLGLTGSVLEAMREQPPDLLIVQTHSDRVTRAAAVLAELSGRCELRVHISIESDRDTLPGLPGPACSVERRFAALAALAAAGLRTVVTVSPLLPIAHPRAFFERIAACADAVVIDHFIEGDGTRDGSRTLKTPLPAAMAAVEPASTALAYRDEMIAVARSAMPGRVGVSIDGFAGRFA